MTTLVVGTDQRHEALQLANHQRVMQARVKTQLQRREVGLREVLLPVYPAVAGVPLIDIIRWQYASDGRPALEALGHHAVRDGINLMMRAGRASETTRLWVVEHGRHRGRGLGV
jgi:hypothetical protein